MHDMSFHGMPGGCYNGAMQNVAIEGFGFMGRIHAACWRRLKGIRIAAVCVRDPSRLVLPVKAYGCVGGDVAAELPPDVKVYTDAAKMLAEVRPDIVDVTLPTALHLSAVEQALAAGAHVLCEKPLALDAAQARAVLRAAGRAKGRFMVAQCLRFAPEYACLKQVIASGKYGAVVAASFNRLTPPPRAPKGASWFRDEAISGGLALDLNIHDADVVNWLFGLPGAVTARGHRRADGLMDHLVVDYAYPDKVVTAEASWAATESFGFTFGFTVFFERATVVYNPRAVQPFLVSPAKGKPFTPKFRRPDSYQNQIDFFWRLVQGKVSEKDSPAPTEEICDSIALVDAERKSAATGRSVKCVKVKGVHG